VGSSDSTEVQHQLSAPKPSGAAAWLVSRVSTDQNDGPTGYERLSIAT
jgi:hypothetical protein